VLGLVGALALMLRTVPALGADADKSAAKAHYEAATRLYDIKEWAKALDEYKAAYLSKPDPAFLFNIGQCYRKLGRLDQALEFYQEYLKKAPPDDPNRPNVEARIRNTDTGDVFEGGSPTKPVAQPVVPPPAPLRLPTPPQQAGEGTAELPASEVGSPEAVGQPAPAQPVVETRPLESPQAADIKPAGIDLTAVEPVGQAASSSHFYGKWWFWTGVGVAVVAGTVAAIVIASGGSRGVTATTALGTQTVFQ
jgi:tetratricopeptide (TPR) repeat protein